MANILTFKFLRELQKKEKTTHELEKLDDNFYGQLSDYMQRKTKIKLENNAEFSMKRDVEHTKIIIRDILNRRERKAINLAILNARGNIAAKNMLPQEKELYEKIKSAVIEFRSNIKDMTDEDRTIKDEAKKKEKTAPDKNSEKIKILDKVPQFLGDDGKNYGPFKKDDIIDMPYQAASILIKIKKAKKVE